MPGAPMFRGAVPVLHVSSAANAKRFYVAGIGFQVKFAYQPDEPRPDPCYMGLIRDGVIVHVSSFPGDGVAGGAANIYVTDLGALHAELVSRGVAIELEPTDQSWGTREMYLADPDGNSIRFVEVDGD